MFADEAVSKVMLAQYWQPYPRKPEEFQPLSSSRGSLCWFLCLLLVYAIVTVFQ